MKSLLPERPFFYLIGHFARRMFASDEEQDGAGVGVGLGMVLAVLASPGAFASIFLLDKYSTLIQWLTGRHIDPYRLSIADEYFFVVLSMTITGLVMVVRWNRLLPDRRDFENLAVLPIPVSHTFLANFCVLLGLALVFAIDVNGVSSILFPFFVTLQDGTAAAFFRIAIAHSLTVFTSSMFTFFGVFALVGVLMLVVPKTWFKQVSVLVRVLLVVALLTEFFSNLFVQLLAGKIPKHPGMYMRLLPSYWFLGVYEKAAGLASPAMAQLGTRAIIALLSVVAVAVISYGLCYQWQFVRLGESSSESLGSSQRTFRLRLPVWMTKILFRSSFEHACFGFISRALLRSERQVMFLGAYIGVGLVIIADTTLGSTLLLKPDSPPTTDLLSIPLLLGFFIVTGLRFVFEMPAGVEANWIFRIAACDPAPSPDDIVQRFLRFVVLPWQVVVCVLLTLHRLNWGLIALYVATTLCVTTLFIELVFRRFQRIPFTCLKEQDMRQLLVRILACLVGLLLVVPIIASIESWMFGKPIRFVLLAIGNAAAWLLLRRKEEVPGGEPELRFEDRPPQAFELLKLV